MHASDIIVSDISRIFFGIPFSAGDFEAGAQKDIIVIFEELIYPFIVWIACIGVAYYEKSPPR